MNTSSLFKVSSSQHCTTEATFGFVEVYKRNKREFLIVPIELDGSPSLCALSALIVMSKEIRGSMSLSQLYEVDYIGFMDAYTESISNNRRNKWEEIKARAGRAHSQDPESPTILSQCASVEVSVGDFFKDLLQPGTSRASDSPGNEAESWQSITNTEPFFVSIKCELCETNIPEDETPAIHAQRFHAEVDLFKCRFCCHAGLTEKDVTDHAEKEHKIKEKAIVKFPTVDEHDENMKKLMAKCFSNFKQTINQENDGTWTVRKTHFCNICQKDVRWKQGNCPGYIVHVKDLHVEAIKEESPEHYEKRVNLWLHRCFDNDFDGLETAQPEQKPLTPGKHHCRLCNIKIHNKRTHIFEEHLKISLYKCSSCGKPSLCDKRIISKHLRYGKCAGATVVKMKVADFDKDRRKWWKQCFGGKIPCEKDD